jgi:predicted transcriptional regulator
MDLTQKKYYTHLKRLIDADLIERVDGAYRHTTLGKIGFKLAEAFKTAISKKTA